VAIVVVVVVVVVVVMGELRPFGSVPLVAYQSAPLRARLFLGDLWIDRREVQRWTFASVISRSFRSVTLSLFSIL